MQFPTKMFLLQTKCNSIRFEKEKASNKAALNKMYWGWNRKGVQSARNAHRWQEIHTTSSIEMCTIVYTYAIQATGVRYMGAVHPIVRHFFCFVFAQETMPSDSGFHFGAFKRDLSFHSGSFFNSNKFRCACKKPNHSVAT